MSNSQGRFAGRTGLSGRAGARLSYRTMTMGRSSLQQAQMENNSSISSNRFSALGEEAEMDITQEEIEEAFQEDLPADISEIRAGNTSRLDMSMSILDNSVTDTEGASGNMVTPKPTNPYYRNTGRVDEARKADKDSTGPLGPRPGGVEEFKVEMESEADEELLEIPGPPTPSSGSGTRWKHYTRIDVILQVSAAEDSATATSRALSALLQGVFENHKTPFEMFPWKAASASQVKIRSSKRIPTKKDKLLEFCYDLYLPTKNDGGRRYFKIWVGTNKPFKEYKEEARPWLMKQNGWAIFEAVLQVERPITIGWFYGSHGDINRSALVKSILKTTGVQVGLKFRAITLPNDKVKGKPTPMAPNTPIRAIHVEVDRESTTYERDLGKLRSAYATGVSDYPMSLELRLVPLAAGLVDPKSGPKLQVLRKSQEKFISKLKNITSSDIVALDREIAKGTILRERILALKPLDPTRSDRLFKGVDNHYANSDLTTFTCLQKDGDEAMATINSLLSRLMDKAETPAMKFLLPTCFSAEAQFAAQHIHVNKETGELQTQDDQIIDAIIEMDLGSDDESISSKKSVSFKSIKSAAKSTVASEVSSFGSMTFQRLTGQQSAKEDESQTGSDISAASEATTVTSNRSKDSRTSSLTKETFETMVTNSFTSLLEKLESSQQAQSLRITEQIASNKNEVASAFKRLEEERTKDLEQRERDKEEANWLRQRDKEELQRLILQESPQRSTHQPTDATARGESYTPTGRQPHGGDAVLTDPGDATGAGGSL